MESLTRSRSTVSSPTLNFSTRQPRIATFRTASAPIAKAPIASTHQSSANSQTCGGDSGGHCDRPGQLVLYIHGTLRAVESGEAMPPNILHPAQDYYWMAWLKLARQAALAEIPGQLSESSAPTRRFDRLRSSSCRLVASFNCRAIFQVRGVRVKLTAASEPGWRNWQTQRTQNPPRATSWGFDPPSRHQR